MNPHCKIGRVKLKAENVVALPNARASLKVADKMREHVEHIIGLGTAKMAGFAMVSWDMDGCFARGTYFRKDGFVGETFLPDFVAAALRRDMAAAAARDVLSGEA